MSLTGEQIQERGWEGIAAAKQWLESTCRADVLWDNPARGTNKLQHPKASAPDPATRQEHFFSFDLGGTLVGGTQDSDTFLAEVKHYRRDGDQGTQYREFLAGCYRALEVAPALCDHFLWITWAPFLVKTWKELPTAAFVHQAITSTDRARDISLGDSDRVDEHRCEGVADRLMIVVISERQRERLSLRGRELIDVRKALIDIRSR